MEEFFFIPMTGIAVAALFVFAVVMGWLLILALRNRVMFKLGVRNAARRPFQTALIVFGLMLNTLVISSAFGIGDTIAHSWESIAVRDLGHTDATIYRSQAEADTRGSAYFGYAVFDGLRDELAGYAEIDGMAPAITLPALLVNLSTRQSEPLAVLFAPDPEHLSGFGELQAPSGQSVSLHDLGPSEVYLDWKAADSLNAEPGHALALYLPDAPGSTVLVQVRSQVSRVSAGGNAAVVMPLSRAQELVGQENRINSIYISNKGGVLEGVEHSEAVNARLEQLLPSSDWEIKSGKAEAIDKASVLGSVFTSVFAFLGLFSLAVGVLLIFLIFAMLASARKTEMGMARAVGMRRRQLMQAYVFEGLVYGLGAGIAGICLGILVTLAVSDAMADIIERAFPDITLDLSYFDLAYHFEPSSMIVAFVLGVMVTLVAVYLSSWGVSRLNIVRAMRDVPEPSPTRAGCLQPLATGMLLVMGMLLAVVGLSVHRGSVVYLGFAAAIAGAALLARWLGLRERLTFTIAGIALLAWSALFMAISQSVAGTMDIGIDMFFFSGITMVLGAVWLVVYNLSPLLNALTVLLGRLPGMAPALKTAIAHASSSRLRTGLTIAMFSLVVFTITFMAVGIGASAPVYDDIQAAGGRYDVVAFVDPLNPIYDMPSQVVEAPGLDSSDFQHIATIATLSESTQRVNVRQSTASDSAWREYPVHGADDVFLQTNGFEFAIVGSEFTSASEVWQTIEEERGYAVITNDAIPTRSEEASGVAEQSFHLEGVYRDATTMPPVGLQVRKGRSRELPLTLIGVVKSPVLPRGVYTSQATLQEGLSVSVKPTTYFFRLADEVDPDATAAALESHFFEYGLLATSITESLDEKSEIYFAVLRLLQGFVALGLVIGIAALGVISVRAVVDRRHEIGVLRAIGYRRRTVQLSFLVESSVVAMLGILIGVSLALLLSYFVVDYMRDEGEIVEFAIPWGQTLLIGAGVWAGSLLMTYLPSWQASRVFPAEALRYE